MFCFVSFQQVYYLYKDPKGDSVFKKQLTDDNVLDWSYLFEGPLHNPLWHRTIWLVTIARRLFYCNLRQFDLHWHFIVVYTCTSVKTDRCFSYLLEYSVSTTATTTRKKQYYYYYYYYYCKYIWHKNRENHTRRLPFICSTTYFISMITHANHEGYFNLPMFCIPSCLVLIPPTIYHLQ